jgi:hypothetical protein
METYHNVHVPSLWRTEKRASIDMPQMLRADRYANTVAIVNLLVRRPCHQKQRLRIHRREILLRDMYERGYMSSITKTRYGVKLPSEGYHPEYRVGFECGVIAAMAKIKKSLCNHKKCVFYLAYPPLEKCIKCGAIIRKKEKKNAS